MDRLLLEEGLGKVGCGGNDVIVIVIVIVVAGLAASPTRLVVCFVAVFCYPESDVDAGDLDLDRTRVDVDGEGDAEDGDFGFADVEGRRELEKLLEDLCVLESTWQPFFFP